MKKLSCIETSAHDAHADLPNIAGNTSGRAQGLFRSQARIAFKNKRFDRKTYQKQQANKRL